MLHFAFVEVGVANETVILDLPRTLSIADFSYVFDGRYGTGLIDPESFDACGKQIAAELVILLETDYVVEMRLADGDDNVAFQGQGWGRHRNGVEEKFRVRLVSTKVGIAGQKSC